MDIFFRDFSKGKFILDMIIKQEKSTQTKEVKEYRKLPSINYSACKDFDESRSKFYRKHILKEVIEEKKHYSTVFGDLVHCLLLTPEEFHNRFATLEVGATPKPQMKALADNLWEVTKQSMSESGQVTRDIESLLREAFDLTAFDKNGERVAFKGKSFEDVVKRFIEEGEHYYRSLRQNFGKEVIDARTYESALKTIEELNTNPITAPILGIRNSDRYQVFYEKIFTFQYEGIDVKAMVDLIIVDKEEKKVYIYDLKSSGWDIGTFDYNIIKNRYYLQWAMYYLAVKDWATTEYKDFEIVPLRFIVVSSDRTESPLIYTTSMRDLHHGLKGFTRQGRVHKGLEQLIAEINWHTTNSIWNISYIDYKNKGLRRVMLFEEI